jgi:hypothetical protein
VWDKRGEIVTGGRHGQGTVCLSNFVCDFLGVGCGGSASPTEQPATLPDLGQDTKLASVQQIGPESHGREVNCFVGVGVR